MRRYTFLGGLIVVGAATMAVAFQGQPAAPLPELVRVKDNLYMIGSASPTDKSAFTGGNTGVFIAEKGVVLVDTKLPGYGPRILERVKAVTPKPVIMVINTHTHGDHTGSNDGFPASVEIVAHENTKSNMEKMDAFKGDKAKFLPRRTYKDKLSVLEGKDRIDLHYFGPGHTNGDTFIVFPSVRVVHTGDMFAWKDGPFIDRANGGSGIELPKSLAKAVAALKGQVDTVLPGHMAPVPVSALDEFQRFTADLVAAVDKAVKAGQGADVALKSIDIARYKEYQSNFLKNAVDAIYGELKPK
jgi:glyoxylase-like metal-dependent hydrolase (beta-lactamase superfamily II)